MIISDKHRYLFIEIPLTGSWAIRRELCKYYDGYPILHKHATYPEFLRQYELKEKGYLVFATVRNPLDVAVSRYFKLRTNHKDMFSVHGSEELMKLDYADWKKYEFIRKTNASFESFFRKYYKRPYSDMLDISGDNVDFVIRFEQLQDDFARVLQLLGIAQVRPVPVLNKTSERDANWESYYTAEVIGQATWVFGPFMKRWGYVFPPSWGAQPATSWLADLEYRAMLLLKRAYTVHFRFNARGYARYVRKLRAALVE